MQENYNHKSREVWSQGILKHFLTSHEAVKVALTTETDTEALRQGQVFHQMMENRFDFAVFNPEHRPEPDKTFASKLNKEWKNTYLSVAAENGKTVIDLEDYNILQKAVESLKNSEIYKRLQLVPFIGAEQFYEAEINGLKMKCKPDAIFMGADENTILCVDWKTTNENLSINPNHLKWVIRKYQYNFQAVHYTEILKKCLKKDVVFLDVFVEKSEPFSVLPVAIVKGSELYEEAYINWTMCIDDAKNFNFDNPEKLSDKLKRVNNGDLFLKL